MLLSEQNLNLLKLDIEDHGLGVAEELQDFSIKEEDMNTFDSVEVVFKDLEDRLVELIHEYKDDMIFGCIAWLTSKKILTALAKCKNVQIIVQKEDFLRADAEFQDKYMWKFTLRKWYDSLGFEYERHQLDSPMGMASYGSLPDVNPVRCVGNYNRDKSPAHSKSHHKFMVFCRLREGGYNDTMIDHYLKYENVRVVKLYQPTCVWTGSFNFTKSAANSFENAIVLKSESGVNSVLNAYLKEHHQIFCLSEPLDWNHDWVAPEYRIGT